MFKTIFAKQFMFYFAIQLFSYLLLALALSYVFLSFSTMEHSQAMQSSAERIGGIYHAGFTGELAAYEVTSLLGIERYILSEHMQSSLIIVSQNRYIFDVTPDMIQHMGTMFSAFDFSALEAGNTVVVQGYIEGFFNEQALLVGYPVLVEGELICAVFVMSSLPNLQSSAQNMLSITIISLMISGSLSFILVFILSRTITRPILEMNKAAKLIASGEFEKRLEVNSADEIGQLAKSLNNMADSLHQQEVSRRIFIENVSHDLRSPLTSIRGFIAAILDGTIPQERQEHYLRIVHEETERLSKLTHEIIDLEKINTTRLVLNRTSFDINALIRKTVALFETTATSKTLAVSLIFADEASTVFADEEKIHRVLHNLIDNAVKFTPEGGSIEILTSKRHKKDKKITVSVKDSGLGIPSQLHQQVFRRFFKADTSRGQDRKGSGLGLSIVSAFLYAHNETPSLKSEEGVGSIFSFELPEAKT